MSVPIGVLINQSEGRTPYFDAEGNQLYSVTGHCGWAVDGDGVVQPANLPHFNQGNWLSLIYLMNAWIGILNHDVDLLFGDDRSDPRFGHVNFK